MLLTLLLILNKMKLVISKGNPASIWKVVGGQIAHRLHFKDYEEQDLCFSTCYIEQINFPVEIVDLILKHLFQIYLETFNFDLCQDLLLFSRSFTRSLHREIYGEDRPSFMTSYHRLLNTFHILENIYDEYLTAPVLEQHTCIKLTSVKVCGERHRPWHFTQEVVVGMIQGLVVDLTEDYEYACVGPHYGNFVYLQGRYKNGLFNAGAIKTPVLNLVFVDSVDTLIPSLSGLHHSYLGFFKLLKRAFGKHTGVFVMVQTTEDTNPFVTRSDLFFEY
jgi:hypothetical protein